MLWTILAVTLTALLAGCSNTKTLTVHTNPQGAVLTWDGQQYLAPTSLSFDLTKLEQYRDASGCFEVEPFTARWASGAIAGTHDPVRLCGDHASWSLTIERPTDPPGLEQDLAAAEARYQQIEEARVRHQDAMLNIAAMGLLGMSEGYAAAQERRAQAYRPAPRYDPPNYSAQPATRSNAMTCTPSLIPSPGSNAPAYNCQPSPF
jgi:hypothetical protein